VEPHKPLFQTVRECAAAAALHDPRFDPVAPEELGQLRIEVSVLSPLADTPPDEVEVGRHGLLISMGPLRGLLLPQVPVEWHWDRERFLEETSLKAGLSPDAWKHGARIQTFTAQIFRENSDQQRSSHHAA
jgi:AmmeMemoRadiSam system protein A